MKKWCVEDCEKLSIFELRREGSLSPYGQDILQGADVWLPLTRTACYFGGFRWWFICPSCHKRVAILYKKYYAGDFLCRQCHDLTYRSSQEQGCSMNEFMKAFRINERYKQILRGIGRKGPSRREHLQLRRIQRRVSRLSKCYRKILEESRKP
jgi:hypothetical protein